jgi:hypothetical protein
MKLNSFAKLPLCADEGWPELALRRPGILEVFVLVVLPLSLLPPAMLYFAGTHYPEAFGLALRQTDWAAVAGILFLAEIGTFLFMGWLIAEVAKTHALAIDHRAAYLLAAIAPVPMWLSSLGLLVPDPAFNGVASLSAFVLSCALLYQGVRAFGRSRDELVAAAIVQIVVGAVLIGWALLFALAFV